MYEVLVLFHSFQVGHVFPVGGWPSWAYVDMWAPEIHRVDDNFHVYFSGRKRDDDRLAIGLARSSNPSSFLGPYVDMGRPIIEDEVGCIDIHWFRDPV